MGVDEITMLNVVVGEMMEIVGEVMAVDGVVAVGGGEVVERGGVGKVDLTPETQRLVVDAEVVLAFDRASFGFLRLQTFLKKKKLKKID